MLITFNHNNETGENTLHAAGFCYSENDAISGIRALTIPAPEQDRAIEAWRDWYTSDADEGSIEVDEDPIEAEEIYLVALRIRARMGINDDAASKEGVAEWAARTAEEGRGWDAIRTEIEELATADLEARRDTFPKPSDAEVLGIRAGRKAYAMWKADGADWEEIDRNLRRLGQRQFVEEYWNTSGWGTGAGFDHQFSKKEIDEYCSWFVDELLGAHSRDR